MRRYLIAETQSGYYKHLPQEKVYAPCAFQLDPMVQIASVADMASGISQ